MSDKNHRWIDPNRGVEYSSATDAERRFLCELKLSGDELANLMEALGKAGAYELQDRVRESLYEFEEEAKPNN